MNVTRLPFQQNPTDCLCSKNAIVTCESKTGSGTKRGFEDLHWSVAGYSELRRWRRLDLGGINTHMPYNLSDCSASPKCSNWQQREANGGCTRNNDGTYVPDGGYAGLRSATSENGACVWSDLNNWDECSPHLWMGSDFSPDNGIWLVEITPNYYAATGKEVCYSGFFNEGTIWTELSEEVTMFDVLGGITGTSCVAHTTSHAESAYNDSVVFTASTVKFTVSIECDLTGTVLVYIHTYPDDSSYNPNDETTFTEEIREYVLTEEIVQIEDNLEPAVGFYQQIVKYEVL